MRLPGLLSYNAPGLYYITYVNPRHRRRLRRGLWFSNPSAVTFKNGYATMKFHNVLDEILGNRIKVKLLRAFFTYPEKKITKSELQRIAGIPQASVHRNVKSLLANGLLERERIGKANLYSLNKEHTLYALIENIFGLKETFYLNLKSRLKIRLKVFPE